MPKTSWPKNLINPEMLQRLLPIIAIAWLGSAMVLLILLTIVPKAREVQAKTEQLRAAHQELVAVAASWQEQKEKLSAELTSLEKRLDEQQGLFISKLMAAQVLDTVYQCADLCHVTIVQMENQPGPKKGVDTLYDVETFRLEAYGGVSDLLYFVGLVHDRVDHQAFVLRNLSIAEKKDRHVLTMDLVLYTSALAPAPIAGLSSTDASSWHGASPSA
ncbi:MAG: hypothetical protein H5T69_09970 [Chloroflexi bacterium]|nr:hypothetical protein [Chloroflexota bacterium]